MSQELLHDILKQIKPVDPEWLARAQTRLDQLTKPRGSLGRLEELAAWYVAVREELLPTIRKKMVVIFAGDHGVVDEGVSAYPQEVTFQMVVNFVQGGAGINVLSRHVGAEVQVVDIGVKHEFTAMPGLIRRKVAAGTRNLAREAAMSPAETEAAIACGIELARENIAAGADILATGEMGIGNTTPAAALAAAFTGKTAVEVTGRGTGVDDLGYQRKIEVIDRALALHQPNPKDPLDVLARLGGLEIAGLTGLILGAAAARRPIMVDGFIATAAALVATKICPAVKDYLQAAHQSAEYGHRVILEHLGLRPLLQLEMRLGEGTGAALGINLLEAGLKIYREMATFAEAGVSDQD